MARNYAEAIAALNSLQSNASVLADKRNNFAARAPFIQGESREYLQRIGYEPDDLNILNVLHVAGTKGKGSTSAFCSSLLCSVAPQARIGLYTSPHLVAVRERIRINGEPIPEEMFAKYFWEVWERLLANQERSHEDTTIMPAYFRYLTIMAFHVFISEKVDATVLEVGIGGKLDSTNLIPQPLATGITALGFDHVAILGHTLPEIASAKAGIYKKGCPALSVAQPQDAAAVVQDTAHEVEVSSFSFVSEVAALRDIKLGLAGKHQLSNASLAVGMVRDFLSADKLPSTFANARELHQDLDKVLRGEAVRLPDAIERGLEAATWPGRCQIAKDQHSERPGVTWYLDGAHTVESLACCAEWFGEEIRSNDKLSIPRILIFNCTSNRTGAQLQEALINSLLPFWNLDKSALFDHAIFCPNTTYASGHSKADLMSVATSPTDLEVQNGLAESWTQLTSSQATHVLDSIESAVQFIQNQQQNHSSAQLSVLVCGSLHLVGGTLEVASLM